ncbi:MAG: hypothetical protein WA632_06760 [Gallionella sp.]
MLTSDALLRELKTQQQAGNWDEVLRMLDLLEKGGFIDQSLAEYLRQDAWVEKILRQESFAPLCACIDSVPADVKRQRKITAASARALIQHDGSEFAQKLLAASLNAQWDGELVALYGDCRAANVVAQIEQAEKWLNLHRNEAVLLLALGKLCLHQGLQEKARDYLVASINAKPSRDAHESMGLLAERIGDAEQAQRYFQQAIAFPRL